MAEKEEDEKKDEMKSQEEELEEYFAEDEEKSDGVKAMEKEDVIAIVRDELKTFWKGVMAGKYPLPKYPYAKKSLTIEGEEGVLGEEGIVIPITIRPVVAEEKSMKTEADETEDEEKKEGDEEKSKDKEKDEDTDEEKKTETGDDAKEEQKTEVAGLQKTIEDLKKELEDLKATPQKGEDDEKSTKKPYRSGISVEDGRISKQ